MDSVDSLEALKKVLRHWRIILSSVVLCGGLALVLSSLQQKKFTSQAQLFVSTRGSAATADALASAYSGSQFSTARVQSYIDLVSSPEISRPVIRQLGLRLTPAQFRSEVSATAPANTVLLNLSVTDQSAERAQRIAAATAQQYIAVIQALESSPGQVSPVRVSVSSPASLPRAPSSPDKKLDVVLGVVLGLLIGLAGSQLLEILDNSVGTDDELRANYGLQVLGHVPYDADVLRGLDSLSQTASVGRLEALRGLRTSLRYIDVDNPPRTIVVSSCRPGDGKTTTCAALAAVEADQGRDVVIIEGDLRRPKLAKYLGLDGSGFGVAELLADDLQPQDLVKRVDRPDSVAGAGKLDLLSAGALVPNPTELLGSQRMQTLVETLKGEYDLVVIDAPPLLPVTDAVVLSTIVDGVLLVVEPGKTTRKELQRATELLTQVDARVLGAVLNKTSKRGRQQYGYGYGYGYESTSGSTS